jgi:hypothetical protein
VPDRPEDTAPDPQRESEIREARCRLIEIVTDAYRSFADYFVAQAASANQAEEADRVFTRGIDQPCP